ncbi:MAG: winged helix family transcriptional regulator, partial [Aquaticitalea sp.]
MRLRSVYFIVPLLALVGLALLGYRSDAPSDHFNERVKIALRDAGNRLLLANQDSTSLVMPVISVGEHRYELSFGTNLYIEPETLVLFIDESIATAKL